MALEIPTLEPCPFCEYIAGLRSCAFVTRGESVSSLLNRTQYEHGALLVVSNAHVPSILEAGEDLVSEVHREARRVARAVVDVLGATGVNIFQNNGVTAGQTVPHYHVHVVPRYASSDPGRRFREADFEETPLATLYSVARRLQAALT